MAAWQDSNLALFGSDTEKQVKKNAAESERAWEDVSGINSDACRVWRIKNFALETVPPQEIGTFYRGDSYIILNVTKEGDKLLYDVHFWIGKESTQDEYGTAAYKTVELDTFLDDKAVQHREVDGCESDKFLSYFPKYKILDGGYNSGFRHVEADQRQRRLFVVKLIKKKDVKIIQVPLSKQSLNSDDVFIIDDEKNVYQWNGKTCNKEEKMAAARYLQDLKAERFGRCATAVCDEGDGDAEKIVEEYLPDVTVPDKISQEIGKKFIHRVSDADGEMRTVMVCEGSLPRASITEDDIYLIDNGKELFVYIGEGCSRKEKHNALVYAHSYLKNSCHPLGPITVVPSGRQSKELDSILE